MIALIQFNLVTLAAALAIGLATGWWMFARRRRSRPQRRGSRPVMTFDSQTILIIVAILAVARHRLHRDARPRRRAADRAPAGRREPYVASRERPYMKPPAAADGPQGNSVVDEVATAATDVAGEVLGVKASHVRRRRAPTISPGSRASAPNSSPGSTSSASPATTSSPASTPTRSPISTSGWARSRAASPATG